MRSRLVFAVALLVALLALLPMRLALGWMGLDEEGLSAREVRGSVWSGHLVEAGFGGAALGDLSASLSPLQLALLRTRVDVARDGTAKGPLEGAVTLSAGGFSLDRVTTMVPAGDLSPLLPLETIGLDDVSVRFTDTSCASAEGRVRATIAGGIAGLDLTQGFQGAIRCEGSRLLMPLASPSGQERLAISIAPGGAYEANLQVRTADQAVIDQLTAAGFIPNADGYRLSVNGRL